MGNAAGGLVGSPQRGVFMAYMPDIDGCIGLISAARALKDAVGSANPASGADAVGDLATQAFRLTFSVGAATASPRQDLLEAIQGAEDALLVAKFAGGDCIRWHSGHCSTTAGLHGSAEG